MQRDNFQCKICGCNDKELHVHHRWYQFGNEIWDYPDSCFETLCFECHEYIEMNIKDATSDIQVMLRRTLLNQDDYSVICRFLIHLSDDRFKNYYSLDIVDAIDGIIQNNSIEYIIKQKYL